MMHLLKELTVLKPSAILMVFIVFFPKIGMAQKLNVLKWKTNNGAHVIFYQAMEVPILDIHIAFAAGSAYDNKLSGISQLTTRLINQGNAGINGKGIAEQLSDTGSQYASVNNQNMVLLTLRTLTEPDVLKKSTQLFASIVGDPDFPPHAFQHEKNQQLMAIAEEQESPTEIANQTFYRFLFKNHPYAHPINGYRDTVMKINLAEVRAFYSHYFVGSNAIIVLVGAINESAAHELAEHIIKNLPQGHPPESIAEVPATTDGMDIEIQFPMSQSILRLGQLSISQNDKRYFPLLVGNYILGGNPLTSRLALVLREKKGFTYSVTSKFLPMPGKGPFLIGLSTQQRQMKQTIDLTRKIISEFINKGPSENELQTAKQFLTGNFQIALSSNRNIANILLKIAFYHLPDDYLESYITQINRVQLRDITSAFKQTVNPQHFLQVTIGKP